MATKNRSVEQEILRQISGHTSHLRNWVSTAAGITGAITGFIKATTALAPVMEQMGAKFSRSFDDYRAESLKMSENFQKASIPSNVYENFAFSLQASRLGLNKNSEALRDLFGATLATGENWGKLQAGLFASVIGMKKTDKGMDTLSKAVDETSRVFNLSREELVAALQSLSRDTLNLMAATGNNSTLLQETAVGLQALIPDQRLFTQAVTNLQKQFTMGGLVESLAMGFPVDEILKNQTSQSQMFKAILDQGTQADKLLSGQGRTLIFQADALKGAFGDLLSKQATATQMRSRMITELEEVGITAAKTMNDDELSKAFGKLREKLAGQEQKYLDTLAMLKRELIVPLINDMSSFFMSIKKVFKDKDFQKSVRVLLQGIGQGVIFVGEKILELIQWTAQLAGQSGVVEGLDAALTAIKDIKKQVLDAHETSKKQLDVIKKEEEESQAHGLVKSMNSASNFQIRQLVTVNKNLMNVLQAIKTDTAVNRDNGAQLKQNGKGQAGVDSYMHDVQRSLTPAPSLINTAVFAPNPSQLVGGR